MKKVVSLILVAVMSLALLTGCGGPIIVNKTSIKNGIVYVFDIDKTSKYTVDIHKNLISIYNYIEKLDKNDAMYFTDVYISGLGYEGTVYISNPKGISKLKGLYIPDNTKIKVSDNNLYIKCGGAGNTKKTGKVFLKNVTITLKSVSDNDKNGKADISFSI